MLSVDSVGDVVVEEGFGGACGAMLSEAQKSSSQGSLAPETTMLGRNLVMSASVPSGRRAERGAREAVEVMR